jgi:hypothetical protein
MEMIKKALEGLITTQDKFYKDLCISVLERLINEKLSN